MKWTSYNSALVASLSRETGAKCMDEKIDCGDCCPAYKKCNLLIQLVKECKQMAYGVNKEYTPSINCFMSYDEDFMYSTHAIDKADYYLYKNCKSDCENCISKTKHACHKVDAITIQIYNTIKDINKILSEYLDRTFAT